MALADVTVGTGIKTLEILASATATNSPPSGASAGAALSALGRNRPFLRGTFKMKSTAGSATMTVTLRLWGYDAALAVWMPLGTGTGSGKGVLNAGAAIDEVSADSLVHAEPLEFVGHFERLYVEITAIGGTSTAVTCYLCVEYPEL